MSIDILFAYDKSGKQIGTPIAFPDSNNKVTFDALTEQGIISGHADDIASAKSFLDNAPVATIHVKTR